MKNLIFMLMLSIAIVGCGKGNSSGGESNGVASGTRYMQLASPVNDKDLMIDNVQYVFELELLKDNTFTLYGFDEFDRQRALLRSTWTVSGTDIVLNGVGRGSYLDSSENNVKYDCIAMDSSTYGAVVVQQLRKERKRKNAFVKFCKRR